MKPKPQPADAFQLFRAHFRQILDLGHPLVRLAERIDGPSFDVAFADSYREDLGAPGKAIRLMVGLQYLKYAFNESDESVVERWVEITDAYVDKSYRGHGARAATTEP